MNKRRKICKKWCEIKHKTKDRGQTIPKINSNLNSANMHLSSKFGNPDFNQWWLIARTNAKTQNVVNFEHNFTLKFTVNPPPPEKNK